MEISKEEILKIVYRCFHMYASSYRNDAKKEASEMIEELERVKNIDVIHCCVNKDLDKHPIEGVNETMQTDEDIEEVQLCGKSNCNRQKLEGNVYCSYHYDINFG